MNSLPFAKNTEIPLILAPLAGYTDYPFRKICKKWGADYCFTEMVSANAFYYKNPKTELLLYTDTDEKKSGLSVQIFGGNLDNLIYTAKKINEKALFNGIDLNLGCWVKKVLKAESGCFLMQFPERINEIFKSLRPIVRGYFSAKMRTGIGEKQTYLKVAELAFENGLDFITLHGRTKEQGFSGKVDYYAIEKLVKHSSIPVIGNGDVKDIESLDRMLETGVSGVMIGRAAIGNPFIFKILKEHLAGRRFFPCREEIMETFYEHANLMFEFYGEKKAVKVMRKSLIPYLKGFKDVKRFRGKIAALKSRDEFEIIYRQLKISKN